MALLIADFPPLFLPIAGRPDALARTLAELPLEHKPSPGVCRAPVLTTLRDLR